VITVPEPLLPPEAVLLEVELEPQAPSKPISGTPAMSASGARVFKGVVFIGSSYFRWIVVGRQERIIS
jgi:hypothetical protein